MKVGVVVVSHNYGRFLHRCLSSLVTQSRPPDLIVVVDDFSTDDTCEVAAQYPTRICQVNACNAQVARNRGRDVLAAEDCDAGLFLDADDWLRRDCIERMSGALYEGAQVAHANLRYVPEHGFRSGKLGSAVLQGRPHNHAALLRSNYICIASLVRCDVMPPFDESLSRYQDWDWYLTMSEQERRFRHVNDELVYAWVHAGSKTHTVSDNEDRRCYDYVRRKHGATR